MHPPYASTTIYQRRGRVARIELIRPDAMNAIDQAMKAALLGALERGARDHEIGAVIMTGAGKAFCTGTAMKSAAAIDGDARRIARTLPYDYQPILDLKTRMDKPVHGAVKGADGKSVVS